MYAIKTNWLPEQQMDSFVYFREELPKSGIVDLLLCLRS